MGRIIKNIIENNSKDLAKKGLIKSMVSLILAVIVLTSSTVCWFTLKVSDAKSDGIMLDTENGLRINDVEKTLESILDKAWLLPASSVDGRNLFFPADGTDFSSRTETMTFRSANAGDRNSNYLQYDFYLTAEENATNIFMNLKDNKTFLYFSDEANLKPSERVKSRAIRAAIYYEGIPDNKPIVFNAGNSTDTTEAVETIDRTDGSFLAKKAQVSYPFKDYTYGKKPIATLNRGETRKFSLIVWIEGTKDECTNEGDNSILGKKIDLSIDFTTSWDYVSTVVFDDSDNSCGIKDLLEDNPQYTLVLNYKNEAKNISDYRFTMYKIKENGVHNGTWSAEIPDSAVNDLEFRIIDTTDNNTVVVKDGKEYRWAYNEYGKSTLNRGTSLRYIAEGFKAVNSSNKLGYGHWFDGEIEEGGNGRDDSGQKNTEGTSSIVDDNDW